VSVWQGFYFKKMDNVMKYFEFEIYMVAEKPQVHTDFADKLCFKKGEFAVDLLP
jgi:hypothetical protein